METVTLPAAPKNASPVPHLTSIHSTVERGPYGNARYPGNCSGQIIKDLLQFFQPKNVFDPMSGSGTCNDVCKELKIPCLSSDVKKNFDACDPACYANLAGKYDFIWLHPPYWRMKIYSDDPRCLSNAANSLKRHGSSRYKGVRWLKTRKVWEAGIMLNHKRYCLGKSVNEEDCAIMYNVAAQVCFGEFARLNNL